jgi:hypothetical protein
LPIAGEKFSRHFDVYFFASFKNNYVLLFISITVFSYLLSDVCEIQHKKCAHKIVERCKFSGYLRRKLHNFLIGVIESIFGCNIKPYEILNENGTLVNCVHYVTVYRTDDLYQSLSLSVKINDINIIIEKRKLVVGGNNSFTETSCMKFEL